MNCFCACTSYCRNSLAHRLDVPVSHLSVAFVLFVKRPTVVSAGTACYLFPQRVRVDSSHRPLWTSASAICNTTLTFQRRTSCVHCVCVACNHAFSLRQRHQEQHWLQYQHSDVTPATRTKSMKPRQPGACKKRNGSVCALHNLVSDTANPHYVSDPLPQRLWDHCITAQL